MTTEEILRKVDHPAGTDSDLGKEIRGILDDAMKYHTASACLRASYVKRAAEYVNGRLPICTVIGFPEAKSYSTTTTKVAETKTRSQTVHLKLTMVLNNGVSERPQIRRD